MGRGMVAVLVCGAAVVGCVGVGRAMQPPSIEEFAQEQFDQSVANFDEVLAKHLRGGAFTATSADRTAEAILDAASSEHLNHHNITSGDDGQANWVDVSLLINAYRSEAGFVVQGVNVDVLGCVRFSVSHGQSGWGADAAQLSSRSIPCPDGSRPPGPATGDRTIRAGDTPETSYAIHPRPPACYSGSNNCPGGG